MRTFLRLFTISCSIGVLFAQLTPEQRAFDFQTLSALYAKRYAPYEWKLRALNFDLMNIQPWLDRVAAARDDLEFYEIEAEYVASFQDSHSYFAMPSTFRASLGITVDIYDGKVLIDSINRSLLPADMFPFQIGDELVSVDDRPVADLIAMLSKGRAYGNPAATRRAAAGLITVRSQSVCPHAVDLGDSAQVAIRRASGDLENYTVPWTKTGFSVRTAGPVPMPKRAAARSAGTDNAPDLAQMLTQLHNWSLPERDLLLQPIDGMTDEEGQPRKFIAGQGSKTPIFRNGFPASFEQRLGRLSGDFHFSGSYESEGFRLGYLRIPGFSPASQGAAIRELEAEIEYFEQNTDGLVVDVMRNSGGGCYMLDAAAHLIPYSFYFFGEEIRATQDRLNSFQAILDAAKAVGAPDDFIAAYQGFVDQMKQALAANRGMTEPIPACTQYNTLSAPVRDGNLPASVVYDKPMIVLVDEFSISAADIFPSMIQDNARAPLVGMRTNGGGGSVSSWPAGFYSESQANNTNTLVVRRNPVSTPDLPTAAYVENIGARPDIELDYMTRENLLTFGQPFVDQFTAILVDQIKKASWRQ